LCFLDLTDSQTGYPSPGKADRDAQGSTDRDAYRAAYSARAGHFLAQAGVTDDPVLARSYQRLADCYQILTICSNLSYSQNFQTQDTIQTQDPANFADKGAGFLAFDWLLADSIIADPGVGQLSSEPPEASLSAQRFNAATSCDADVRDADTRHIHPNLRG
jgi:hypothetical protein